LPGPPSRASQIRCHLSLQQTQAWKADSSLSRPSQVALRRELNSIKYEQFPWMAESTKCAPQEAIIALGFAFRNFFAGRAKHPSFKKRGPYDSFKLSSGQFRIDDKRIRIPKVGWVRMRERLRYVDAKQVSVTVSRQADRWFAAIQCELPAPETVPTPLTPTTVGVDVGVREFVASDGTRYKVPRNLRHAQRQLKRAQQSLARKTKGSKKRQKARMKVACLHARIADTRADWLHKLTTSLTSGHDLVVIEDLNVAGMAHNHHLALSIADASFGEFRRQLTYKTETYGQTLVVVDRWFPSSKLCSSCGAKTKHPMPLHVRTWTCDTCNAMHDRDLNAARNLATYDPAVSSTVAARGEFLTAATSEPSGVDAASRLVEPGTRHQQMLDPV
ncbi:RNA-guided endonuclease InsQ/TnpB family protein, partial [Kocuria massiliensis]|uniref:RNA-guided endonuclease InsQ/TnpB family protein n=1 Tax=Kocuria massiliensis TaxID=1926282 RepID=UPI0022B9B28A